MADKERFIKATDFIKSNSGVTFGEMAKAIGEDEHAFSNIRRGNKKPSVLLINKLIEKFPESEQFFATNVAEIVNEPSTPYGTDQVLRELVRTQARLIDMMELELEKTRIEIKRLRDKIKTIQEK